MVRTITVFIIAIALSSCGKAHDPTLDLGQFGSYVDKFQTQAARLGNPVQVTDLRIQFGPIDSVNEHGVCEISPDGTPTITVRQSAWDLLGPGEREALLFHEMGHCVLHRLHADTLTSGGLPQSVMNSYLLDETTYDQNHDGYMTELFTHKADF